MASRTDTNRGLTENFGFDALNRLVSSNVNSSNLKTIAYDALGNITSKSDTGTYTYGGVGQPVHGVTGITGAVNTTFTYDANGNMVSGNNRTITWNAANQPLTITDSAGLFAEANSYDPWGKRRFDNDWADDYLETITSETNRGFTSHEHLEEVGLVHMNGRLYDARIGRMISADPNVQAPLNPQNYNRYTYALNNPLAYTDPSGFFFKKIKKAFKKIFRASFKGIRTVSKIFGPTITRIGAAIASIWACGPGAGVCYTGIAIVTAAEVGVSLEQGATIGQALKSGAFTAASAYIAGSIGADKSLNLYEKAVLHGVSQGGLSVAQGGSFKEAFLSASFSKILAGNLLPANINPVVGTVVAAAIGGTASVIGGGKFANGATTAAFVYAFNAARNPPGMGHNQPPEPTAREKALRVLKKGLGIVGRIGRLASPVGAFIAGMGLGPVGHGSLTGTLPVDDPNVMGHIFRDAPGHVLDTIGNRAMLNDVAGNAANYQFTNKYGTHEFAKIRPNGTEAWAHVRDGVIRNGGLNLVPQVIK